jgi:hypothetical protein
VAEVTAIRGWRQVVPVFATLRWTLLRANLRGPSSLAWGTGLALLTAAVVGAFGGLALWVGGRTTDRPEQVAVVAMTLFAVMVAVLGLAAGVAQAVDPRVISTEPLHHRDASLGQLVLVASGPAGIAAFGLAFGFLGGWSGRGGDLVGYAIALAVVIGWLVTMLLISRGATSLLGLLALRHPRTGQLVAGFTVLGAYIASQVVPRVVGDLRGEGLDRLADWARWSPPGQLGVALAASGDDSVAALGHLAVGSVWLFPLGWGTYRAMHRLRTAQPRVDTSSVGDSAFWRRLRRSCGSGARGALAYRTATVRLRTPREILQTVIGSAIGFGVALGPVIATSGGTSSVVLIGGAVQLTVLITAGNAFGVDGPALTNEVLAGASAADIAAAKARATIVLGAPMLLVPLLPAALTAGWHLLPAGLLVAAGALLAGAGGAVAQSAYAPIALPDTDNPFASGDTGRGCLVGVLTTLSLLVQAALAVPVGLALFSAFERVSTVIITLIASTSLLVGIVVLRAGERIAARRLEHHFPDLLVEITPSP